jgi:iron complex transport system ATP-binding protein
LDLAHQVEVLELLRRLNHQQGRTIVAVLHDLNEAARYADHLVVMRDGGILAQGAAAQVMTADLIAEAFGLECVVIDCPVTGNPLVIPAAPAEKPSENHKGEKHA